MHVYRHVVKSTRTERSAFVGHRNPFKAQVTTTWLHGPFGIDVEAQDCGHSYKCFLRTGSKDPDMMVVGLKQADPDMMVRRFMAPYLGAWTLWIAEASCFL